MKPSISVIIPTHNRIESLKKCLDSIEKNKFRRAFEIIIVDDKSTDNTVKEIRKYIKDKKYENIYLYKQEKGGPAKARNLGIKKANGKILLIIGDDSIADKNLLNEHFEWQTKKFSKENIAVLGHNQWSKEIEITPFMKWIDQKGMQFSYYRFKNQNSPHWGDFWTCNISIKKSFLIKYGLFDESFPYAAWEDTELGHRLSKHGLKIKYNKLAKVEHYHPTSFESVRNRMVKHGYSQMLLADKMGNDYKNILFNQPYKIILDLVDLVFTYSGLLKVFELIAFFIEKRIALSFIFYPILFHYKLKGNREYRV